MRVYKEDSTLHLLYEYFPLSLEKYVQHRSQTSTQAQRDEYAVLYEQFNAVLTSIVHTFIQYQIKTDISFHNFAVSHLNKGVLKLFLDPEA